MKKNKNVTQNLEELTQKAKQTPLGQEVLKEVMQEVEQTGMWVNDISPDGKIIGRIDIFSGKYEKLI